MGRGKTDQVMTDLSPTGGLGKPPLSPRIMGVSFRAGGKSKNGNKPERGGKRQFYAATDQQAARSGKGCGEI